MLLMQIGFTYLPFMHVLFHSAPMPLISWLWVVLAGAIAFLVVGFEKWLRYRRDREPGVAAGTQQSDNAQHRAQP
jgi:Ca2+-transporting ATPase